MQMSFQNGNGKFFQARDHSRNIQRLVLNAGGPFLPFTNRIPGRKGRADEFTPEEEERDSVRVWLLTELRRGQTRSKANTLDTNPQ
ncbi:hypothetical protein KQX54_019170 [Cotesia glomerata]|uniref:Uncharacterized protein n=1 Tax=Cotesia glomerata TaxID=32391 RepID=A0AAV7J1Y9_COTGL|nr:hypothetical protein KQX54_019170 [Cotesia glomerata]